MSTTAQSRDLSDPRTIETFAATVQTLERLRMLLVLTVCDIRAVGPGVWNGWKGQLLRTLYWETEVVLTGGHSTADRKGRVLAAQRELQAALPGLSDPEFEAYAARHYQAYWLKVELARKVKHAKLLRPRGSGSALARNRGRDRRLSRRDGAHRAGARPSAPALDHRGRLRGGGREYRRRADFHHDGRAGARHDLHLARL